MTVYVDDCRNRLGRMVMCHMIADKEEELHEMAARIGMRREWFQPESFPHYDVCLGRKAKATALGAIPVSRRELVRIIRRLRDSEFLNGGHGSDAPGILEYATVVAQLAEGHKKGPEQSR